MSNMNDRNRLLKLQQDLENGIIFEDDLSEEDIDKLEQLYKEQISLLKEMQDVYRKKIEFHKENIRKNIDKLKKIKDNS